MADFFTIALIFLHRGSCMQAACPTDHGRRS
jgi:hypothetical protein